MRREALNGTTEYYGPAEFLFFGLGFVLLFMSFLFSVFLLLCLQSNTDESSDGDSSLRLGLESHLSCTHIGTSDSTWTRVLGLVNNDCLYFLVY